MKKRLFALLAILLLLPAPALAAFALPRGMPEMTFQGELPKGSFPAVVIAREAEMRDVSGWAEVSEEQVIARDPDYIVTCTMYFGEGATPDQGILSRAGWQDVSAVKNGRVYVADSNAITRPGPRLAEAAHELYAFVYGE